MVLEDLREEVDSYHIESEIDLQNFKDVFLSKKGKLSLVYSFLKQSPEDERPKIGFEVNELKTRIQEKYDYYKVLYTKEKVSNIPTDLSLTGVRVHQGNRHPLKIVENKIISIFNTLGFGVEEGPEIEDDWHNFTALNFASEHPARDMQDTFFLDDEKKWLLRTHTSSVQVRVMEAQKPPIRLLMPGRVYRNEAISSRSHSFFHQLEGLVVDKNISFADMKQTLKYFVTNLFNEDVKVRFRPSYFPFTEISAEMDISCQVCNSKGCKICKESGWVEILGCGMIDPQVFINTGIDEKEFTGFAFGMGIERIAQLLYKVPDIRLYSQNDIKFLRQFNKM